MDSSKTKSLLVWTRILVERETKNRQAKNGKQLGVCRLRLTMVVRDTATEGERSFACHFLHILFFFSRGKMFRSPVRLPQLNAWNLKKKDNKGQK